MGTRGLSNCHACVGCFDFKDALGRVDDLELH
jgi:hypothetical protein